MKFDRNFYLYLVLAAIAVAAVYFGPSNQKFDQTSPIQEAFISRVEQRVHFYINAQRQEFGKAPLEYDEKLAQIARSHSNDMAANNFFSHENLQGKGPTQRVSEAGYSTNKDLGSGKFRTYISENAAYNLLYRSVNYDNGDANYGSWKSADELAREVADSWMASGHHRNNIMDPEIDREGIGVAITKDYAVYVTQIFW